MAAVTGRPLVDRRGDLVTVSHRTSSPVSWHPQLVGDRPLELVDRRRGRPIGGQHSAQDPGQRAVGDEWPVEQTDATWPREPTETVELSGERSVTRHALDDGLVQRDAGVAEQASSHWRREAGRRSHRSHGLVEPGERDGGVVDVPVDRRSLPADAVSGHGQPRATAPAVTAPRRRNCRRCNAERPDGVQSVTVTSLSGRDRDASGRACSRPGDPRHGRSTSSVTVLLMPMVTSSGLFIPSNSCSASPLAVEYLPVPPVMAPVTSPPTSAPS